MAVEQLKNLIGVIRKDPSRAPDGQYDQVSQGKTSVVADLYNLNMKDKRALAEVCQSLAIDVFPRPVVLERYV
jgi:hypothetical protein